MSVVPIHEMPPGPSPPRKRRKKVRSAGRSPRYPICVAIHAGGIGPVLRGVPHPLAGPVEQYFASEFRFATPTEKPPRCLTFPELVVVGRLIAPWARLGHATANDPLVTKLLNAIGRQGLSRAEIRSLYGDERATRVLEALERRADAYQELRGAETVSLRVFAAAEVAILLLHRPTDAFPERI